MDSDEKIRLAYMAIGVFLVVLFGMIWTRHHRAARTQVNTDDMLNRLNNQRTEDQKRAQARYVEEARERQRAAGSPQPAPGLPFPAGFDEQTVRDAIEACAFFREPIIVMLPKQFRANLYDWATHQYPALPVAIREGLVRLDPPFDPNGDTGDPRRMITVMVPSLTTSEVGDDYRADLGYRRVDTVTVKSVKPDMVGVEVTWTVQASSAADLLPEGESRTGYAYVQRLDNAWRANFRGLFCQ